MATYAVGDIQGCQRELEALLSAIAFAPSCDRLWLTGDLVNRGPASLAVMRTVMALGESVVTVLGNHDLHLVALALGPAARPRRRDTVDDILAAADRDAIVAWLRRQPLVHTDEVLGVSMVHAGLPPAWSIDDAHARAREVETVLRDDVAIMAFLDGMYGDQPASWRDDLHGAARLRFITNCFTRMRFVDAAGALDLAAKGTPDTAPAGLLPWYAAPGRRSADHPIVFGHWSTLRLDVAASRRYRVYPLDTGAVWGGALTALRLEDGMRFSVASSRPAAFE